jgi:hypothetical protein
MTINIGDRLRVEEEGGEWLKGESLMTGTRGIFPRQCVQCRSSLRSLLPRVCQMEV